MRNKLDHNTSRNPLESYAKKLFEQYPAHCEFGINIRRSDARLRLKEILQAEPVIKQAEEFNAQISNNIARMSATHELNMQYLIQYGVRADQRIAFQQLLEQVSQHGGLSLRETANLTHAMAQSNGSTGLSNSMATSSTD